MKHEFEKNLHIIGDLFAYGHSQGASEYNVSISRQKDMVVFTVKVWPVRIAEKELEKLVQNLNAPRQREVEQSYWGLSGDSQSHAELALVGMMSDETEVDYTEDVLTIIVRRHH